MATRRSARRSSSRRRTSGGIRISVSNKPAQQGLWLGALAAAGVAAVGGVLLYEHYKKPAPGPGPGPLPNPNNLPTTGDVWGKLSSSQQADAAAALWSAVNASGACPGMLVNGPSDIPNVIGTQAGISTDGPTRAAAVTCFQQTYNATNATNLGSVSGEGVLDLATYNALMGVH